MNKKKLVLSVVLSVILVVVMLTAIYFITKEFTPDYDGTITVEVIGLDNEVVKSKEIEFNKLETPLQKKKFQEATQAELKAKEDVLFFNNTFDISLLSKKMFNIVEIKSNNKKLKYMYKATFVEVAFNLLPPSHNFHMSQYRHKDLSLFHSPKGSILPNQNCIPSTRIQICSLHKALY